tara:strand:- start:648 stop:1463 length:816 start_codon:yes stop_codon:yes gene_type:complete
MKMNKNMKHSNLVWWGGYEEDQTPDNWGDILNTKLYSLISGVPINKINRIWLGDETSTPRYYCIGSNLNHIYSDNAEVWGGGFEIGNYGVKVLPKKIHAVRGPLTRKSFLDLGAECPEIYGDPALLYPIFYKPNVKKEYKYGIIPHFSHQEHPWLNKFKDDPQVNIIDVRDRTINKFVDEVNKCEIILSSSLHGIICADSYSIPSYFIDLSPGEDEGVNYFKLNDYYMSVKRPLVKAYNIKNINHLDEFYCYNYTIDINLNKLLLSCPFLK